MASTRRSRRDPEGRMALRAHLVELRNRVIVSAAAVLVLTIVAWNVHPWVFELLVAPLEEAQREDGRAAAINYPQITAAINQQVTVSLWLGVLLASPVWIYQVFAFVLPGLTRRERWYALGFVVAAVPLFLGGVALAFAILPNAIVFLVSFGEEGSSSFLSAGEYLSFVMRTMLAFGIAFLTPVVMVAMTMMGLVGFRTWLKGWRLAVLFAFVFAAIASPTPDPFVMFALAGPMIALYFLAVGVTWFIDRRRARREGLAELDDDEAGGVEDAAPLDHTPDAVGVAAPVGATAAPPTTAPASAYAEAT